MTPVLSASIVAVDQALILVGMAWAISGRHVRVDPLALPPTSVVGALAGLRAIGVASSGFARDAETAARSANLVTFPRLVLSGISSGIFFGIFFGIDSVPARLRPIARVLPLADPVDAPREPMTRGRWLGAIWSDLPALAAGPVVAIVVAVRFVRGDVAPT